MVSLWKEYFVCLFVCGILNAMHCPVQMEVGHYYRYCTRIVGLFAISQNIAGLGRLELSVSYEQYETLNNNTLQIHLQLRTQVAYSVTSIFYLNCLFLGSLKRNFRD